MLAEHDGQAQLAPLSQQLGRGRDGVASHHLLAWDAEVNPARRERRVRGTYVVTAYLPLSRLEGELLVGCLQSKALD